MVVVISIILLLLTTAYIITEENQKKANNNIEQKTFDSIYQKYGKRYGINPYLIKAIVSVESSGNPDAVNLNPSNPDRPSYGLMQILCQAKPDGGCRNKFYVDDWPPEHHKQLLDPDYNVKIGSQILAWNIATYGYLKGIAVYNCWEARLCDAPFPNQGYVDKVTKAHNDLVSGFGASGEF